MSIYKYNGFLKRSDEAVFDDAYPLGAATPHSGIYRCEECGREIVSEQDKPFPPQNHHQHNAAQGDIQWRLIVYADHEPK
jgi:hypothetical protein